MCIQRRKAEELGLAFFATFENIAEDDKSSNLDLVSPLVEADESRVK